MHPLDSMGRAQEELISALRRAASADRFRGPKPLDTLSWMGRKSFQGWFQLDQRVPTAPPTEGELVLAGMKGEHHMKIRVSIVVEPDGERFHAYCPAFQGLHIDGATEQDAVKRTCEAVEWYLDSLERHGDPLPVGPDCVVDGVRQPVPVRVPAGSILKSIDVPWPPSLVPSGIS